MKCLDYMLSTICDNIALTFKHNVTVEQILSCVH